MKSNPKESSRKVGDIDFAYLVDGEATVEMDWQMFFKKLPKLLRLCIMYA